MLLARPKQGQRQPTSTHLNARKMPPDGELASGGRSTQPNNNCNNTHTLRSQEEASPSKCALSRSTRCHTHSSQYRSHVMQPCARCMRVAMRQQHSTSLQTWCSLLIRSVRWHPSPTPSFRAVARSEVARELMEPRPAPRRPGSKTAGPACTVQLPRYRYPRRLAACSSQLGAPHACHHPQRRTEGATCQQGRWQGQPLPGRAGQQTLTGPRSTQPCRQGQGSQPTRLRLGCCKGPPCSPRFSSQCLRPIMPLRQASQAPSPGFLACPRPQL